MTVSAAIAVAAALVLVYTYVGYPIVIATLARLFPAPPLRARGGDEPAPRVSVLLPVYNGAKYLRAKLDSLLAQDYPAELVDILIYCDGCADDSEAVARAIAAEPASGGRIRVIAAAQRRGKPAALNVLQKEATGELLLMNDVRQPFSPNAVRALAATFADPAIGCATGLLVLAGGAPSGAYWRYEAWIRRCESRFRGVVGMTGAIAMTRRADLVPLPEDLILDDVWIPARLALAGKRVVLVTEAEAFDTAFDDDAEFRRKVRTLAGNYQLFGLLPGLLSPAANPAWLELVSHKLLRLVAPWAMLVFAASSLTVASGDGAIAWLARLAVAAQLGFYAAALAGKRGGKLAGVARTFVVLNAAAVVGLFKHVRGRQRVTW
ncbi:MAG TPA: glycosyltransferase family 2 protein [Polyangia bacterium]|nr:glycosyltransferase family 2 protein [Polyangia bacterium]